MTKLFIPRKNWVSNIDVTALLAKVPAEDRAKITALLAGGLRDELANYLAIERWAAGQGAAPIIFNLPGVVQVSVSPLYIPVDTVTFTRFYATLTVSGSTDSTVVVLKNGSAAGTLTIAGGTNKSNLLTSAVTFTGQTDSLQFAVTGAGAGAANLVCEAVP